MMTASPSTIKNSCNDSGTSRPLTNLAPNKLGPYQTQSPIEILYHLFQEAGVSSKRAYFCKNMSDRRGEQTTKVVTGGQRVKIIYVCK